jgi:hypothetical protein
MLYERMSNFESDGGSDFHGDPYLDPSNVYARADGTVIAYGPHGMEFELTDQQRMTVEETDYGILPTYSQRIVEWGQTHRGVTPVDQAPGI